MKTHHVLTFAICALLGGAVHAADKKLENAQRVVERIIQAQPPVVSTTTVRTPQQAITEYKNSGKAPNSGTLKINPVPAPKTR